MFPVFFSLGPFTLLTSSVIAVMAVLCGFFLFWKRAHEEHYEDDDVFDVALVGAFIAIVLARIGFVSIHLQDFQLRVWWWIAVISHPGLYELAGIVGGLWGVGWLAQQRKWDHYEVMDFASIGVSFFLAMTWFGRFLAGTQLGKVTQLPWGIVFPNTFDARHPVQLYAMVCFLIVTVILAQLERRYRFFQWYRANKQSAQSGFIVGMFFILYGVVNLAMSSVRVPEIVVGSFGIDGFLYLLCVPVGIAIVYVRSGHWSLRRMPQPKVVSTQERVKVSWWRRR